MSLTYAQKRAIQEKITKKSVEEIASELGVAQKVVEKHIDSNPKIFSKQLENPAQPLPVSEKKAYFVMLGMIVIALYINGLWNAFVSDDIFVIVDRADQFKSWSYFLIHPLTLIRNIQFFLAYHIGGIHPFFFRLPNLLFHIGFVIMVYQIMPFFSKRKYLPFIVACIAAVHPMMVESVTWISGGIYAQAGFFALLSLYFYLRARREKLRFGYLYASLFFIASISSSEKTIILPFIIMLYELTFGNLKKTWKYIGGFFGIALAWGLTLVGPLNSRLDYLQVTNGAASKFQFNNPFVQVPVALSKYLELFTWPDKLTLYQSEYAMGPFQFFVRSVVTILFFVIIAIAYKKNKSLFFWLSFFFITLLTTLNPFGLSWIVAERYSYLGSIGLYFGFVTFFYWLIERTKLKTFGYTVLVIILVALSVRTIVRNLEWHNEDTLWVSTARVSQADPKTHNNMGDVYSRKGDLENAAKSFEKALEINPNYPDATHNLANIRRMQGDMEEATRLYKRALELNPGIWQSDLNLAAIYFDKKEYQTSLDYALAAYKINPQEAQITGNIGLIYLTMENPVEAKKYFELTLSIDPENQVAQQGIASLKSVSQ